MPVERRKRVVAIGIGSTGNGRNLIINGRRQPSCGDTSRMNREVHVRFCEGLGVEFPGPTRPCKNDYPLTFRSEHQSALWVRTERFDGIPSVKLGNQRDDLPGSCKLLGS